LLTGVLPIGIHSWNLWRKLRDNYKASLTAIQSRMSDLKELDGNLCYVGENPTGKSFLITGQGCLN